MNLFQWEESDIFFNEFEYRINATSRAAFTADSEAQDSCITSNKAGADNNNISKCNWSGKRQIPPLKVQQSQM